MSSNSLDHLKTYINELRTTDKKQAFGYYEKYKDTVCAIGVSDKFIKDQNSYRYNQYQAFLDWINLPLPEGARTIYKKDLKEYIVDKNDNNRLGFKEIADLLEELYLKEKANEKVLLNV
jgi:hypothetical protein